MAMSKNSLDLVEKRNDLVQLCNEIQEILAERRYRIENDVASSIEEANELFKSNPTMESKASLSMVLEDIDSQKKLALVSGAADLSFELVEGIDTARIG